MAIASLLTLLDDVASVLDDVATMTKVAARKTSGVLGDDLALNAQQISGVNPDRELPVVWAVAKGSLLNKAVLVPAALVISYFVPWAVALLLLLGGLFLCYEGAEKVLEKLFFTHQQGAVGPPAMDEKTRIRGAVRTDFILSAEIIVITLGVVADFPVQTQIGVLCLVAVLITLGVYGLVASIVKLDDLGLFLYRREGASGLSRSLGLVIIRFAPWLLKTLAVVGTLAMFLVGGGILTHTVPGLHHVSEMLLSLLLTDSDSAFSGLLGSAYDGLQGLVAGLLIVTVLTLSTRCVSLLRGRSSPDRG